MSKITKKYNLPGFKNLEGLDKLGFWGIIFILFFTASLMGQNLRQLEINHQNISNKIYTEQTKLDSLNFVYNKMITAIDLEKQKNPDNKNTITEMLAEAVVVSNQIEAKQAQVSQLENELEAIKKNLDSKYAAAIDSLENLEKSNLHLAGKESLKTQRMKYIEKRLLVAPKIYSLSFDPQKLVNYKPSATNDSLEQKIYSEYLSNALNEVIQQSQQVSFLKNEIEGVIHLQNETADFIEDVDSDIMFNPAVRTSPAADDPNALTYTGGINNSRDEQTAKLYSQANSYLHIFNQLKTSTTVDAQSPWQTPTDTIPANLTFQQYLELLKEVDNMLQDYRTILEHKLESD